MARSLGSTIAASGDFHRTGRLFGARRGPGVVRCMSYASGNRRTASMSSDKRNGIPNAPLRQAWNINCDRIEMMRARCARASGEATATLARQAVSECKRTPRAHPLRSNDKAALAAAGAIRPDERLFAKKL